MSAPLTRMFRRLSTWVLAGGLALGAPSSPAQTPVPVPPAVAIARPSPEEIGRASAALNTFLAQADSGTKALAEKYPDLLAVRPPRANPALIPSLPGAFFRGKHNANLERARQGGIDLLFMGDSITDFWRNEGPAGDPNPPRAGKTVFDQYFGQWKTGNFGISGDHIAGVLYRLQNGESQGFQPKAVMLMIGTNDASSYPFLSAPEIAEGIGAVILELRQDFPQAKILLLGIFPRGNPGDEVRQTVLAANPIIAKLNDGVHVFYLDIGSIFLGPGGVIPRDIMADLLHPNRKGYVLWAEAVKGQLAEMMK
jgi:lysophospholipase L1-like esterase